MNNLTHVSLFSGIGGLDLAAEAAGFETVCQCEWADFPHSVLSARWPDVPRFRDITTFTKEAFFEKTGLETVTVISVSYTHLDVYKRQLMYDRVGLYRGKKSLCCVNNSKRHLTKRFMGNRKRYTTIC